MINWIAVEEIPPEFDIPVLVCNNFDVSSINVLRLEAVVPDGDGTRFVWIDANVGGHTYWGNVTHYLPLESLIP